MRGRAALLALCALALAGCGQRSTSLSTGTPQPMRVAVTFPNAAEAPIYAAKATTGFRESGLKVSLIQEGDGAAAIRDLNSGKVDLAVSTAPDLLEARDRGARVVAVGALVQRPLSAVISLRATGHGKGRGLAALASKPVGTMGFDYQAAFAEAAFPHSKVKKLGSDVERPLLAGTVGAVVGYSNYQGIDLTRLGKHPQVVSVDKHGVPSYPELVLVANEDALARDARPIRAFVGALARSSHGLRRRERAQVAGWVGANPKIPKPLQTQALAFTLPLAVPPAGRPFGWQDAGSFTRLAAWMRGKGLLKRAPASPPFTNTYLPGQGL